MTRPRAERSMPAHAARGPSGGVFTAWFVPPLAIALIAFGVTVATLSPQSGGPGITCDEYYDVAAGKQLVAAWLNEGTSTFRFENVRRHYGHLTPHPPLGRWLLGWAHWMFDERPRDPSAVSVIGGRFAAAFAYAALILLVGLDASWQSGRVAGIAASASVALVPRMFGQGHLASLDTFAALFYVAAVLALVAAMRQPRCMTGFALAGLVWGLALLTKMQGVVLLATTAVWMLWHLRTKAIMPLALWFIAGVAVFFAGWPWLWLDPIGNLRSYFSSATARQVLHVFYEGQVFRDVEAPWHYPWVMTLVTLPTGLLLLGLIGAVTSRRRWLSDPRLSFVLLNLIAVLTLFSVPRVPVYDGVRLFLMVYPLWAILVGEGAARAWDWLKERGIPRHVAAVGMSCFLLLAGIGIWVHQPCWLSHYAAHVGGLWGAERLGFEVTYWGDSIQGTLLEATARDAAGQRVIYAPHLAPFQAAAVEASTSLLRSANVELMGYDASKPETTANCRFALVYNRRADFEALRPLLANAHVAHEFSCEGVWLGRLYQLPDRQGQASRADTDQPADPAQGLP